MGGGDSKVQAPNANPASAAAASNQSDRVYLNVYSPTGGQHAVYHSGLQVFGVEYVFGGGDTSHSGVSMQRPKIPPPGSGWVFYQTVEIGALTKSRAEVERVLAEVRADFPGSSYNLVSRNCNHFSDDVAKRICGQGIPSWVNLLAGIGGVVKGAVGKSGNAGAPAVKADTGAGGLAAAGLISHGAADDGDLRNMVKWSGVGVDNAKEPDAGKALGCDGLISSDDGSTGELLVFMPFESPVKLQELRLESPQSDHAPSRVRIFANPQNLNVDDAAGGVAATQEFLDVQWTPTGKGAVVATVLKVNFLKFQNLGNLACYFGRMEGEDEEAPVGVQNLRLFGRT